MRTFLDSRVLLTAWRGREDAAVAALAVLDDERREFVTSQMVKLELMPKPAYHKNQSETDFYQLHFATAKAEEPLSENLGREAQALGAKYGLAAADALNICAALRLGAMEFITSEAPSKPLFRVPGLKVVSLHAAADL